MVAKAGKRWRVLPHEWAFGAFLLVTALRLLSHTGLSNIRTVTFFALLLMCVAMIGWTQVRPTPTRWRLRLLWYPCAMGLSFYALTEAVRLMQVPNADVLLSGFDDSVFGGPAAEYFRALQGPLFTDLMTSGYLFFFVYLILGPAYYCVYDLKGFRACFAGMFTTYALGFLGYTLWPAGGPHLALHFQQALPYGPLAQRILPAIDRASNGVDVFPSIHAAVSLYLLVFDWWFNRGRFKWFLVPCILLWFSTVYLRYHYAVDLAGGLLIAGIGLITARRYYYSALERSIDQEVTIAKLGT